VTPKVDDSQSDTIVVGIEGTNLEIPEAMGSELANRLKEDLFLSSPSFSSNMLTNTKVEATPVTRAAVHRLHCFRGRFAILMKYSGLMKMVCE
jgi:hypothetical protein